MNDNSDLLPNLVHEDAFEVQMRGYSRRQVDEFTARCRGQIRDLEQRLARALDEGQAVRRDLADARQQALGAKPAHEEVSERIAQILRLADDEARSQKAQAAEEIAKLRDDARADVERVRAEAREHAERMLTAAQEQAERAITSARAEAERTTTGAREQSEAVLADAKSQAKKALDEATARATAIHDGAERRLNLLSTRHADTIKRLTEILDGVSALVSAENARMPLEEEVEQVTAKAVGSPGPAAAPRPVAPTAQAGPNRPKPAMPQGTQRPHAAQPAPAQRPPGAPAGQAGGRPGRDEQVQPGQATRPQARADLARPGEQAEGVRVMRAGQE